MRWSGDTPTSVLSYNGMSKLWANLTFGDKKLFSNFGSFSCSFSWELALGFSCYEESTVEIRYLRNLGFEPRSEASLLSRGIN